VTWAASRWGPEGSVEAASGSYRVPVTTAMATPARVLGRLADEDRLRVLGAVALGATTVREIAERADLPEAAAARALGQLLRTGIVSQEGKGLQVDLGAFAQAARQASPERQRPSLDDATPEQAAVLRNFVNADGRIRELPARAAKRALVLEYVAARIDPDRGYSEREINGELVAIYDDHVTLRRYLVDAGLLTRKDGVYRRAR
jgi:hypothetical protein